MCWEGCGGTGGGGVDGREKSWMFGCVVRAEAQQQALRTPNTRTSTHKEMTHKPHPSRPVLATFTHTHAHTYRVCTHLSVIVEVPQVQAAHAIHSSKHGRVHGRPHDIIHIIGVVFKRVQRLVVLKERREKKRISVRVCMSDMV